MFDMIRNGGILAQRQSITWRLCCRHCIRFGLNGLSCPWRICWTLRNWLHTRRRPWSRPILIKTGTSRLGKSTCRKECLNSSTKPRKPQHLFHDPMNFYHFNSKFWHSKSRSLNKLSHLQLDKFSHIPDWMLNINFQKLITKIKNSKKFKPFN